MFSLNTVVGFACALGMDMEFNSQHHENADAIAHQHEEGTPSHHHDNSSGSHHHDDMDNHPQQSKSEQNKKDNCCNDNVIKFEQLDKSITNAVKVTFNSTVFAALVHVLYFSDIVSASQVTHQLPIARWCFPAPPDIRVSIQSFQI